MSRVLSYAHGAGETPLIGRTIGEDLRRTAAVSRITMPWLSAHQGVRADLRQLWRRRPCSRARCGAGIGRGDRVGIWAPNCDEWVLGSTPRRGSGAILVNVNPAYRARAPLRAAAVGVRRLLVCADALQD